MSPENPQPDQNEKLRQQLTALENGKFLVERSDKSIETGWEIEGEPVVDKNGDLKVTISHVERNLTKPGVLVSDLLSWQPAKEDDEADVDTIKRADLWARLEANEAEPVASEEVREEIGKEALDALDVAEPASKFEERLGPVPSSTELAVEDLSIHEPTESEEQGPDEPETADETGEEDTLYNEALDRLREDMEQKINAAKSVVSMVEESANNIGDALVSRLHYAQSIQEVVDMISLSEQAARNVVEDRSGLQQLATVTHELDESLKRFKDEQADAVEADHKTGEKYEKFVSQVRHELTTLTEQGEGIKDTFTGMHKLGDTIQGIKDVVRRGGVFDTRNFEHETGQIGRYVNEIRQATQTQQTALRRIESAFQEARL